MTDEDHSYGAEYRYYSDLLGWELDPEEVGMA